RRPNSCSPERTGWPPRSTWPAPSRGGPSVGRSPPPTRVGSTAARSSPTSTASPTSSIPSPGGRKGPSGPSAPSTPDQLSRLHHPLTPPEHIVALTLPVVTSTADRVGTELLAFPVGKGGAIGTGADAIDDALD